MSNPILLQLGVITGKKRRRRDSDADISFVPNLSEQQAEAVQQKLNEIALLERFMAQVISLKNTSFQKKKKLNYWRIIMQCVDQSKSAQDKIIIIIFNLCTAACKAYCAIWVRRSNFRHQASQRVSPRESTQRRKMELWARNVWEFA